MVYIGMAKEKLHNPLLDWFPDSFTAIRLFHFVKKKKKKEGQFKEPMNRLKQSGTKPRGGIVLPCQYPQVTVEQMKHCGNSL